MINQVILIGRLTRDAECVEGTQTTMARMRVATDHVYRDSSGVRQERAEFHSVVAFGRLAEVCSAHYVKGRLVVVLGRLRTRDYEGSDGIRRHSTEIVADQMRLLGRPGAGEPAGADAEDPAGEPGSFGEAAAPERNGLAIALAEPG